jgi:chorismate--pyruvate lyase
MEPAWNTLQVLRRADMPAVVADWLRDTGSLTARLKGTCRGGFSVRLLDQGWKKPLYSEGRLLAMRHGEVAIVREVELMCGEAVWVFARTVIPASSLRGPARRLSMLGTKPLGEVLFSDPQMRRGPIEVARLQPRHALFATATNALADRPDELWGRRTIFYLAGMPLLVNEIFLPNIQK